jgi:hypothetical protein
MTQALGVWLCRVLDIWSLLSICDRWQDLAQDTVWAAFSSAIITVAQISGRIL